MPSYDTLLRNLTLGTARQAVGEDVVSWLETRDAIDPTANAAEQLLATWSVTERLERLEAGPTVALPEGSLAPVDERSLPGPRLSRGLQLIMRGTYPRILPEALRLLKERNIQFPPFLLPDLLDKCLEGQDWGAPGHRAMQEALGARGQWLAALNPAWARLREDYDFATAFSREGLPGARAALLKRWRLVDPAAAREAISEVWDKQSPKNQEMLLEPLFINPVQEDLPWLRERIGPKRRGVRRAIFRLLLLGGEQQATEELMHLAASSLTEAGKINHTLTDKAAAEVLVKYGGTQKKESLAAFLLDVAPPHILPDLLGQTGPEFWAGLPKEDLKVAANTLLQYPESERQGDFVRFACKINPAQLPVEQAALLTAGLPQAAFLEIFHELMDEEKNVFYFGGVPRLLVLSREEPWSERITKAFVLQLVKTLREVNSVPYHLQRDMQAHWKLAVPLLEVSSFGWLRTQLHAMTERADSFGKLATEVLQTTAFRRALREG